MDYSNLIKQAARITWRYKFLWFFGIMMALYGQEVGESAVSGQCQTTNSI
jgi:hypothetical protein